MNTYNRKGRPREYTLQPISGIPDRNMAVAAAMLQESRERVVDLVRDLPFEALCFRPQGTAISIGSLVIHLVWAEAGWIHTITTCGIPPEFRENIDDIGRAFPAGQDPPLSTLAAVELVDLCKRIEVDLTLPALLTLKRGFDSVIYDHGREMTPLGVMMHLIWHWTYHSAQIGLLREQWGADYTWTMGSLGA